MCVVYLGFILSRWEMVHYFLPIAWWVVSASWSGIACLETQRMYCTFGKDMRRNFWSDTYPPHPTLPHESSWSQCHRSLVCSRFTGPSNFTENCQSQCIDQNWWRSLFYVKVMSGFFCIVNIPPLPAWGHHGLSHGDHNLQSRALSLGNSNGHVDDTHVQSMQEMETARGELW